jgi:hypothetical protein
MQRGLAYAGCPAVAISIDLLSLISQYRENANASFKTRVPSAAPERGNAVGWIT